MKNKRQHGQAFDRCELRIVNKESDNVTSFILSSIDGQPLPLCQAGQFVVSRLLVDPDKPPVLRSYSLSDLPATDHFRISVKSESNGIGSLIRAIVRKKRDVLDVNAPRGNFTLRPSQVLWLLSAGVGATPVCRCCTHSPPNNRNESSGGSMERAIASTIHRRRIA